MAAVNKFFTNLINVTKNTKKFIFIAAVLVNLVSLVSSMSLVIFCDAPPVFAASGRERTRANANTKSFADVPADSWVYDAVARLASRGIISGYPDGLYKGKQSITRYEAASATARAMAYFDRRRADAQDAETLKKLMTEFGDELDALGVRVDSPENDMEMFRKRLGGWHLSGTLRMDIESRDADNIGGGNMGYVGAGEGGAKLNLERREKNGSYFRAQFFSDHAQNPGDDALSEFGMEYFYAKIPFYYGSFITAGLAGADDLDARFAYETPGMGRYSTWGWFDDDPLMMLRLDVNFVIFNFTLYAAHGTVDGAGDTERGGGPYSPHAWNLFTNFDVMLNQRFRFGLGAQYLIHDDWDAAGAPVPGQGKAWSDIFTTWFGVDYGIFDGATAHGIVYYQKADADDNFWSGGGGRSVGGGRPDGGTAWRLALDFSQEMLSFTSLYAEYMRVPGGFFALNGIDNNMLLGDAEYDDLSFFGNVADYDFSVWKIGANQQWSDKISTWLFYADVNGSAGARAENSATRARLRQYGLGIEYAYSNYMMFGLNYLKWSGRDSLEDQDYSRVRFTTQISF